MARAEFNTTCDIRTGPGSITPGLFIGTFPCRVVIEDQIATVGAGAPDIPSYLTLDAYQPRGAWTNPFFGMAPELADEIAVPSGGPYSYWVLYTDQITPHGLPQYYRAYLILLPVPPIEVSGGVILNGSAALRFIDITDYHLVGSGGVILNGSAALRFIDITDYHLVGSGGVILDSRAAYHVELHVGGSGGTILNGSASWRKVDGYRIYDTFNVSNQTNNGRTPTNFNLPGGTWTNFNGTASVVSNTLQGTVWSGANVGTWITNGQRANFVQGTVTLPNSASRQILNLIFRYQDPNNYYWGQIEYSTGGIFNNTVFLQEIVAGVSFTRATPQTVTINPNTPYTLTVLDDGTNMSATVNGVSATYSSTSGNARTGVGVMLWSVDNGAVGSPALDEFKVN